MPINIRDISLTSNCLGWLKNEIAARNLGGTVSADDVIDELYNIVDFADDNMELNQKDILSAHEAIKTLEDYCTDDLDAHFCSDKHVLCCEG